MISIHKALTSLDSIRHYSNVFIKKFQSTRLSRASTSYISSFLNTVGISIHKALTSLDEVEDLAAYLIKISIHKALTSLDGFDNDRL